MIIQDDHFTDADIIAALLAEYPALDDYDPAIHLSKEEAGKIWRVDPKTAMMRLQKMAREGKLVMMDVRNPASNKVMKVFTKCD